MFNRMPSLTLRAPSFIRPLIFLRYSSNHASNAAEHLPRIAQPSLWKGFIPRFLRRDASNPRPERQTGLIRAFLANPASGVIILAMLTGNASIHLLNLRREMTTYTRQADAKIELLAEVIRRVQNGEKFDVAAALGTGDPKSEEEWFDVMKEIENDQRVRSRNERQKDRREARRLEQEEQDKLAAENAQNPRTDSARSKPQFL